MHNYEFIDRYDNKINIGDTLTHFYDKGTSGEVLRFEDHLVVIRLSYGDEWKISNYATQKDFIATNTSRNNPKDIKIDEHLSDKQDNEPKKYIFIMSPQNNIYIVEVSAVYLGGFDTNGNPTRFEFISQEKFNKVIEFHKDTDNHCPMLQQCWLSRYIDLWEDTSDFIIYDTEEAARKAGELFKSSNINYWPEADK